MTSPRLSSFAAPRLLAGFGTLTLLASLGLFASRPAHTASGPIAVSVANAPLATVPTDEVASRQPFQATTIYFIPNGSNSAYLLSGYSDITVPAGKRLVIQTVSVYREFPGSGETVRAYISPTTGGLTANYPLPLVPNDGTGFPGATQSLALFADPGSTIYFEILRTGTSGTEDLFLAVSGYLVDAP